MGVPVRSRRQSSCRLSLLCRRLHWRISSLCASFSQCFVKLFVVLSFYSCRAGGPAYVCSRNKICVIATGVLMVTAILVIVTKRGPSSYPYFSLTPVEQTQVLATSAQFTVTTQPPTTTRAKLTTRAKEITHPPTTPQPSQSSGTTQRSEKTLAAKTQNVSVVLTAGHGSSQISIKPERIPAVASLSNVYISVLTVPSYHNPRFSFQLMTWLQTFNPEQVDVHTCN